MPMVKKTYFFKLVLSKKTRLVRKIEKHKSRSQSFLSRQWKNEKALKYILMGSIAGLVNVYSKVKVNLADFSF